MSTAAATDARGWKVPHADRCVVALARDQLCLGFVDGNGSVGHGGGAPGMNGDLRIYPKSAYVVVVLANSIRCRHSGSTDYLDPRLPES